MGSSLIWVVYFSLMYVQQILQHKKVLIKHVVAGLQGEELGIKLAALKCVLFWSRSPQHLRTTLVDNEIWKLLLEVRWTRGG